MGEIKVVSSLDQLPEYARSCAGEISTDMNRYVDSLTNFFRSLAKNPSIDYLVCFKDSATHSRWALRMVAVGESSRQLDQSFDDLAEELKRQLPIVRRVIRRCDPDFLEADWYNNPHLTLVTHLQFDRAALKL